MSLSCAMSKILKRLQIQMDISVTAHSSSINSELKSRPYVSEFPNARFYAGVPITSSQGVNIGAYCILDDEPREGISDRDLTFMRHISHIVMTHLETIRALSERK